jgi:hypothetical protein
MDWSGLSAWTGRDNPFFLGKRGGLRGVGRDAPARQVETSLLHPVAARRTRQ